MLKSYSRLLGISLLCALLLPPFLIACNWCGFTPQPFTNLLKLTPHRMLMTGVLIAYVLAIAASLLLWRKVSLSTRAWLEDASRRQATHLDQLSPAWRSAAIVVAAGASLFVELAIIRWQGTILPIFAFYKNYSLLASFAGLGLGYSLARKEAIPLILSIPVLGVQFVLLTVLREGPGLALLWQIPFREQLSMGSHPSAHWVLGFGSYCFLAVVFLLTVTLLLPVGQLCGRLMSERANLEAYGLNLLGSILGVVLISGISFFWTPPSIWFCIAFCMLLAFQQFDRHVLYVGVLASLAALAVLEWPMYPGTERIYSPYQLLERRAGDRGLTSIRAAGQYYQNVWDLSPTHRNFAGDPELSRKEAYYDFPYRASGGKAQWVAVVGAGTGNDVAAALRSGSAHVDAIEIDPAILEIGRQYHPEKPYDDPRVVSVVNDARTFMRSTSNHYDMIVYGLLDSHTLLSHASSVRLDSFVYTVQGLREARMRLNPNGILSLSFSMMSVDHGAKIYRMLQEAFDGKPPICIRTGYDGSVVFLETQGEPLAFDRSLLTDNGFEEVSALYGDGTIAVDVSTDDWPFFYMPRRTYPSSYMVFMGLILVLSLLVTGNFVEQKPEFSSAVFFLLGAGFMLVETKAITEMGLAFGNTWHVIGIVIIGILTMAFLANLFVQQFRLSRPTIPFVLLIASLVAGYLIAHYVGFSSSVTGKLAALIVLTCPMFFSGMVFSTLLREAHDIAGVMAVNLLGSLAGGVLEYNSMYFGFGFLYLLAAAIYMLAFGSSFMKKRVIGTA